jgi:hypothetical protein
VLAPVERRRRSTTAVDDGAVTGAPRKKRYNQYAAEPSIARTRLAPAGERMATHCRVCVLACMLASLEGAAASAQDRLFTLVPEAQGSRPVEIGAISRFGQVLGPVPADVLDFPGKARLFDSSATTVTSVASGAVLFTAVRSRPSRG